jgi:hypothetical protein
MHIQRGCRKAALFDYRLQITDYGLRITDWKGWGGQFECEIRLLCKYEIAICFDGLPVVRGNWYVGSTAVSSR